MSVRIQQAPVHTIIAPSRLVSGFAILGGYDMGVAATAEEIEFEFPVFELDNREFAVVRGGRKALTRAYEAYHWRQPLTDDEWKELVWHDVLPVRTAEDQFREQKTRLKKLRAAVANGDRDIPEFAQHGLVMTVTTVKVEYGPVPEEYMPKFPFRAVISVDRLADRAGLNAASPAAA